MKRESPPSRMALLQPDVPQTEEELTRAEELAAEGHGMPRTAAFLERARGLLQPSRAEEIARRQAQTFHPRAEAGLGARPDFRQSGVDTTARPVFAHDRDDELGAIARGECICGEAAAHLGRHASPNCPFYEPPPENPCKDLPESPLSPLRGEEELIGGHDPRVVSPDTEFGNPRREAWRQACNEYLAKRVGTYDFRCRRYDAVIDKLNVLGVAEWDVVYDLGAGMCELDRRLRERELHLRYVPVDGCIDGTDLNDWRDHPSLIPPADAFVLIEVIEHLRDPLGLLTRLLAKARKGIVITTPNADRVDVLGMDETHRWALTDTMLRAGAGLHVETRQLFNDYEDTLVGWRKA